MKFTHKNNENPILLIRHKKKILWTQTAEEVFWTIMQIQKD